MLLRTYNHCNMERTYYILLVCIAAVTGNPCLNQALNAVPHPYNCNTFIVCWMSKPFFLACPIGSLFDTITNNCKPWQIAMCCNYKNLKLPLPLPLIPNISSTKLLPEYVTSTLGTISLSTSTLIPKTSTLPTQGTTAITSDTPVPSTSSKGTSAITSVMPVPSTSSKGTAAITSNTPVPSTSSKGTSTTEINTNGTDPNTVSNTLATITTRTSTLPPITSTLSTKITTTITPVTSDTEDSGSICTTNTKMESSEPTATKGDTKDIPTIPNVMTEIYTTSFTTKHPLQPTNMPTEIPVNKSTTSHETTITASTASKGTIEISTSGTERSTKSPLASTTSIIITDSSQSPGITIQEKNTLKIRPTLPPVPSTPMVTCHYYKPIKTTPQAPIEQLLPDCLVNDDFVYPDLVNCDFYFHCFNGVMQWLNCRPNFGFNPHLMKCVPKERSKCGRYKSAGDQKLYFITFMMVTHAIKKTKMEINNVKVKNNLKL